MSADAQRAIFTLRCLEASILEDPYAGSCIIARQSWDEVLRDGRANHWTSRSSRTRSPCLHQVASARAGFPSLLNTPSLAPGKTEVSVTRLGRLTRGNSHEGEPERQLRDLLANAGFLSIYRSSWRHNTSCDTVGGEEPVARVEGAKQQASPRQPNRRLADMYREPR